MSSSDSSRFRLNGFPTGGAASVGLDALPLESDFYSPKSGVFFFHGGSPFAVELEEDEPPASGALFFFAPLPSAPCSSAFSLHFFIAATWSWIFFHFSPCSSIYLIHSSAYRTLISVIAFISASPFSSWLVYSSRSMSVTDMYSESSIFIFLIHVLSATSCFMSTTYFSS